MSLVGIAMAAAVLALAWVDEGEVATLVTFDRQGGSIGSRIWIVDIDGRAYVRASQRDAEWLVRLRERPVAHLSRGNGMVSVHAVPVDHPAVREAVNRAMQVKYGSVDRVVEWLRDPARFVPVRLEPMPLPP
jgi:hypothetical protein